MNSQNQRCNKRCFSYHSADAAIEKARKSKSIHRHEKRFYHCPSCECYHLTSKDKRGEQTDIILKYGKDFKKYLE